MDYLPVFLKIKDRPCLVVGGGKVAARKVRLLARADASITLVSPELCDEVAAAVKKGTLRHVERGFREGDLDGVILVIAATDDAALNRSVSELARRQGIPVNVVDNPALCSFIMPSIIDRSPLQVAVSTGGKSPVLARLLRARLESFIPAAYGQLAKLVDEYRQRVKDRFADVEQRRYFWESILQGRVAELLFAGQEEKARTALQEAIDDVETQHAASGEVYLVGAGPGDPDLITFRALRLMQQADVVVYDRLVSEPILDMVRRDAEMIYAGKQRDQHTLQPGKYQRAAGAAGKGGQACLATQGRRSVYLRARW